MVNLMSSITVNKRIKIEHQEINYQNLDEVASILGVAFSTKELGNLIIPRLNSTTRGKIELCSRALREMYTLNFTILWENKINLKKYHFTFGCVGGDKLNQKKWNCLLSKALTKIVLFPRDKNSNDIKNFCKVYEDKYLSLTKNFPYFEAFVKTELHILKGGGTTERSRNNNWFKANLFTQNHWEKLKENANSPKNFSGDIVMAGLCNHYDPNNNENDRIKIRKLEDCFNKSLELGATRVSLIAAILFWERPFSFKLACKAATSKDYFALDSFNYYDLYLAWRLGSKSVINRLKRLENENYQQLTPLSFMTLVKENLSLVPLIKYYDSTRLGPLSPSENQRLEQIIQDESFDGRPYTLYIKAELLLQDKKNFEQLQMAQIIANELLQIPSPKIYPAIPQERLIYLLFKVNYLLIENLILSGQFSEALDLISQNESRILRTESRILQEIEATHRIIFEIIRFRIELKSYSQAIEFIDKFKEVYDPKYLLEMRQEVIAARNISIEKSEPFT